MHKNTSYFDYAKRWEFFFNKKGITPGSLSPGNITYDTDMFLRKMQEIRSKKVCLDTEMSNDVFIDVVQLSLDVWICNPSSVNDFPPD